MINDEADEGHVVVGVWEHEQRVIHHGRGIRGRGEEQKRGQMYHGVGNCPIILDDNIEDVSTCSKIIVLPSDLKWTQIDALDMILSLCYLSLQPE